MRISVASELIPANLLLCEKIYIFDCMKQKSIADFLHWLFE